MGDPFSAVSGAWQHGEERVNRVERKGLKWREKKVKTVNRVERKGLKWREKKFKTVTF